MTLLYERLISGVGVIFFSFLELKNSLNFNRMRKFSLDCYSTYCSIQNLPDVSRGTDYQNT